jgi:predicted secreted Zn-dependent protease
VRIQEIYEIAIRKGIAVDPRGEEGVRKELARRKKDFDDLQESEKKDFDQESLRNPYSDTRVSLPIRINKGPFSKSAQ